MFWNGIDSFQENEYWFVEAINELKSNNLYSGYEDKEGGIYYYDMNRVIAGYTYHPQQYLHYEFGMNEAESENNNFFSEENYVPQKWIFSTTNTETELGGSLLLGYCTTLGKKQDKVMVFYAVNRENYGEMASVVYNLR